MVRDRARPGWYSPVALAVGVDKLVTADPAAGLEVFDGALDVHDRDATLARLLSLAGPQAAEPTGRRSVFMEMTPPSPAHT